MCSDCEIKKEIFCNFDNPNCKNLYNFRVKAQLEYNRPLCIIFEKKHASFPNVHCVFPIIQGNTEVNERIFEIYPYLESYYDKQRLKSLPASNIHVNEMRNWYHFIFFGRYTSTLEVFDFFDRVVQKCKEENISEITILDFKYFSFSKSSLEICFQSIPIKVYLFESKDIQNMNELSEYRYGEIESINEVKKLRVLPKRVKKSGKLLDKKKNKP